MQFYDSFKYFRVAFPIVFAASLSSCGDATNTVLQTASQSDGVKEKAVTFTPELAPTVYRFAKISTGAYFYTGSEVEVQTILNNYPDFRYEGPAFERDASGAGQEVFRFANVANGGYFYTGSAIERDQVIANYPNMRFEGSTFSVAPAASTDGKQVFRLANLSNGAYLFTSSASERDYAVSLGNWRYEGSTFRAPKGSVLTDRAWQVGRPAPSDMAGLLNNNKYVVGIADNGSAHLLYVKSNGGIFTVYASRGVKNGAGDVDWTTPQRIDLQSNGTASSYSTFGTEFVKMAIAPNGNVLAYWSTQAACNASTFPTSGTCGFIAFSTFSAATGIWSAASVHSPSGSVDPGISYGTINNNGDIAFNWYGWENVAGSRVVRNAVSWRIAGQLTMQSRIFTDLPYGTSFFSMDSAGNMVLAKEALQNAATNIVAYRGSLVGGFGAANVIDQRSSAAKLIGLATTPNGRSVIAFQQSNGTVTNSMYVAESKVATPTWQLIDFNSNKGTDWSMFGTDLEVIRMINRDSCTQIYNELDTWKSIALPPDACDDFNFAPAFNRNGDFLGISRVYAGGRTNPGPDRWLTYDAMRNKVITLPIARNTTGANPGFITGLKQTSDGWLTWNSVLSANGHAVHLRYGEFDVLPTPSSPRGDGRTNAANMWSFYFN